MLMREILLLTLLSSYFNFNSYCHSRDINYLEPFIESWFVGHYSDADPQPKDEKMETPRNEIQIPDDIELTENLSKKIVGQDEAIQKTVDSLLCYQAGIVEPNKPIACLLYVGPSGVGKTELAKELTRQLFRDETRFIRFNMSEYASREEALTRLIGLAKGYEGSIDGGLLSNAILDKPYSLVLLDEFEKAHVSVKQLFLQVFDEGYFTSARGDYIDCRNCIFILTSNLCAEEILELQKDGIDYEEILPLLESNLIRGLSPELYNRLETVVFKGLDSKFAHQIIQIKLNEIAALILEKNQIDVHFDASVVTYLLSNGYSSSLGARPLIRLVKNQISAPLAKFLIRGNYKPGSELDVWLSGKALTFQVRERLE